MEEIQKKFLKKRLEINLNQQKKFNILRQKYINNVRNINKELSLLIAQLYSLKFNFENIYINNEYSNKHNNEYINEYLYDKSNNFNTKLNSNNINHSIIVDNTWNNLKDKLNEIILYYNEFINSNYSILYKSEIRNSVSSNLIKVLSKSPSNCKIDIYNCKDIFMLNGKKIYSKIINNKYILIIDNLTIIEIPTELVQLQGDSIIIEYTDIFTSRFNDTYYYKGLNKSIINKISNIFDNNISDSNIQTAISLLKTLL